MTFHRLFAVLLLGLAGCASEQSQQIVTPFLDGDFNTWKQPGPYTVTGQAFYKLPNGRVMTCAGEEVLLIPAVGYNTELEQILQTGNGYPANYDRHAHKYEQKAMCDGAGKFSFDKVPALNWILLTRISWQEENMLSSIPYVGGPTAKGGYLFNELQVDENHTKIVLSNQDFFEDKK
jgi:hypothetical protein